MKQLKYYYIKDKNFWYKKTKSTVLKVGDKLVITKTKSTKKKGTDIEVVMCDQPLGTILLVDDVIKCDDNGKLYVDNHNGRIYTSEFISELVIGKYKAIKNKTKKYMHNKKNCSMFLVTSFDKDFVYHIPKSIIGGYTKYISEIFKLTEYCTIFTYKTWKSFGFPVLAENIIVASSAYEYNKVHEILKITDRARTRVLRGDIYSMTDGRCNLDLVVDLVKLATHDTKQIVAFFEPMDINNTFYFFKNVIVLRNDNAHPITVGDKVEITITETKKRKTIFTQKEVYITHKKKGTYVMEDGNTRDVNDIVQINFPTDKFVPFFQERKEFPSKLKTTSGGNSVVQIYKNTLLQSH